MHTVNCILLMTFLFVAGTTKRKELHGTVCIHALSGTWAASQIGATFHAYKLDFSCNIIEEIYSGFVLLIESKLDDDVGNVEIDLYLISKTVKSYVSSCGKVYLDSEQVYTELLNSSIKDLLGITPYAVFFIYLFLIR